jgi:hypothetical protein
MNPETSTILEPRCPKLSGEWPMDRAGRCRTLSVFHECGHIGEGIRSVLWPGHSVRAKSDNCLVSAKLR